MTVVPFLRDDGEDLLIAVRAVPGASRDEIAGTIGDRLKVRVAAPPQDGRANKAVCTLIARALGIRAAAVTIDRGHGARDKTVRVRGVKAAQAGCILSD